ncbi:MarR family winged helix-turn-helix transcriptional regulator [Salinarimonas rosea]|uniref:MarR family winged helix-turn-helix transcriptional regulator n=1 Tax=Salinarimonas rosea TaxID=552063 RepID=UPI00040BD26F|nr:MarR family winged helix-turn-helix transcriptional regulator [Salinarimonas rosea]
MKTPIKPRTLRSDAASLLDRCTGVRTRSAARRVTQFLDEALSGCGLSFAQVSLMAHLAAADDDRLGALARRLGVDQSTLSRNLRVLERAGLVEIASVEADLRRRAVWLTEEGARRLEAALPAWRTAQETLERFVAPDLVRALCAGSEALGRSRAEG